LNITSRFQQATSLSGSILLSHPSLKDPNFSRSIVFLSNHSQDDGTLGVILNRPLGKKLFQLDEQFNHFSLGQAEVYDGGPVEREKLIIAAWDWKDSSDSFRLHFGIDITKAESLRENNHNIHMACFLGHSGWSPGQLEDELKLDSWLVTTLNLNLFEQMNAKTECWKAAVSGMSDEMRLLADAPEKPWRN
jgi:putative transcriptional regulator